MFPYLVRQNSRSITQLLQAVKELDQSLMPNACRIQGLIFKSNKHLLSRQSVHWFSSC